MNAPGVLIRDYRPEDWPAVCRVHDRSRPDELRGSFDPRSFVPLAEDPEAEDIKSCDMFVAQAGDTVAGFAGIDDPYLAWLYVDPAFYRRGIGRALLRHCLARLGKDAWTYACGNNTPALDLYRDEGFVIESRFTGTNAGFQGPSVRLALFPERKGWTKPRKSEMAKVVPSLSYLSSKTAVKESPIHGKGLFAVAPIAKDEIVCVKGGYVFPRSALGDMPAWYGAAELSVTEDLCIGPLHPEEREGAMVMSNHSCDPNIGVVGQIVFVAMRDIRAGEELTHDWATTDDEDYTMTCRCGAPGCRKVITGQDWRRKDLQEKYRGYLSWYIERRIEQGG